MIRAIIFDCFGVLVTDALKAIRDELYASNPEGALEVDQLVRAANVGAISPDESSQRVAEILGTSVDVYRGKIRDGEARNEPLFDYILELRKTYKTAMLSNISAPSLHKRFTDEELQTYFDVVVTSGEIGFAKPSPEIYEITADRLGLRCDECIFTDDRELFTTAATSVGMYSILYTNFTQLQKELSRMLADDDSRPMSP